MLKQISTIVFMWILLAETSAVFSQENIKWDIFISKSHQVDEAIKVALKELQQTGIKYGLIFTIQNGNKKLSQNSILVGSPDRNELTAKFINKHNIMLQEIEDPQGYEIVTQLIDGRKIMTVSGGSIIGDIYGIYWIWDRIRVFKEIPEINVKRNPALKTRISLSWGRRGSAGETKEQMHRALQYSFNWISGPAVLDLVPWNSEPERTNNKKNRERTKKLIDYAHKLHLKYYSFANEFTYHPSLLAELGASLTPDDPKFWEALQEKYRRLFRAIPELDGIELCNDDISGFWENYRGFDLMHEGENCEWRYDKRFQTFVKKVHDVVVGEFNKTYFHFTWSLVTYEQGSEANMFRRIFTEEVPVQNLYLIPKITTADRWWHQPYNPTFNLTPHNTIVGFETMNYYEGSQSNIFPTFAGQYYQAGLQMILRHKSNNVKGAGYLVGSQRDGWDTRSVYSYVLFRLSWNPNEDMKQIAEDFCAIHFGRAAAKKMAEIYLLTPVAYKYGLHIEPVSYGQFNSFIHMRVGTFPAQGYPSIDGGKEHLDFLHTIYLRCKPWKFETINDLDHGLKTSEIMVDKFKSTESLIADSNIALKIKNALNMTRLLIHTNNLYVKTAFAYFEYRENPLPHQRNILNEFYKQLIQARDKFKTAPGFGYRLFGVNQILKNTEQVLTNLDKTEQRLEILPTREELEQTITEEQQSYKQILERYKKDAIKYMHFEVEIDGRDILIIKDNEYQIEHLRWDGPSVKQCQFFGKLPQKVITVIPKDIESRPMHPFVLQQPNKENDYTTKIYLYDKPGGFGIVNFDLYYIPKNP
ncbi:DUF4838 domain-containing protein, partial [Planctomycetota bacterium]